MQGGGNTIGFFDDLGINVPKFSLSSGLTTSLMYVFIFIVFLIILSIGIWIYIDHRKYKFKILIFENQGGTRYTQTGTDRAKLVRLGDGGEEILYLKRRKIFRNAYGRKMGHNTYWFAIGQDGYWYNCTLGDLDAKQGMLDIEPIDRDMRYMHVAIRKNIADRYRSKDNLQKYMPMIVGLLLVIIFFAGIWWISENLTSTAASFEGSARANQETQTKMQDVLVALDNVISGSGIKQVSPVG